MCRVMDLVRRYFPGTTFLAVVTVGHPQSASAAAVQDESVLLRVAPPVGQVSHYRVVTESRTQSPGGEAVLFEMRQEMYLTHAVARVLGDTCELDVVIDSTRTETPGVPEMAAMLPDMSGLRQRVTVTTGGTVLATATVDSTVPEMLRPFLSDLQQVVPGLSVDLPKEPVRAGETWTATHRANVTVGNVPVATRTEFQYELTSIARRDGALVATIGFEGTVESEGSGESGGPAPRAGAMSGTVSGSFDLDLTAGRVVRLSSTTQFDGEMPDPTLGEPMQISMTTTQTMDLLPSQ